MLGARPVAAHTGHSNSRAPLTMFRRVLSICVLVPSVCACAPTGQNQALLPASINVAMDALHWHKRDAGSSLEFVSLEGFPYGLMRVKQGGGLLDGVDFSVGTIEFDILLQDSGMPGLRFRRRDEKTSEELYVRPGPDCPASDDCLQYAPVIHGAMLWDEYPQYQHAAPVNPNGWNHFRLVMSDHRMSLFVNGQTAPSLAVGRLQGEALGGGLELRGPAVFANLSLHPGVIGDLPSAPLDDPTAGDTNLVRDWLVSGWSILPKGASPDIGRLAAAGTAWSHLKVDEGSVANLNRLYDTPDPGQLRCVAWLKTVVRADQDTTRRVSVGWLREAWIFVNGRLVFTGRNFWDPPGPKLRPDGRLALENATADLPLRRGDNEIAIALSNEDSDSSTHFGWGLAMRFQDITALHLR